MGNISFFMVEKTELFCMFVCIVYGRVLLMSHVDEI